MKLWVKQSLTGFFLRALEPFVLIFIGLPDSEYPVEVSQLWSLPSGGNIPDSPQNAQVKISSYIYLALVFQALWYLTQEVVGINMPNYLHEFTCVSYLTSGITFLNSPGLKTGSAFLLFSHSQNQLSPNPQQFLLVTLTQSCPSRSLYFFFNWVWLLLQCCVKACYAAVSCYMYEIVHCFLDFLPLSSLSAISTVSCAIIVGSHLLSILYIIVWVCQSSLPVHPTLSLLMFVLYICGSVSALQISSSVHFSRFHIYDITQYSLFLFWLTHSVRTMSRSIHASANDTISLLFMAE